MEDGILGIHHVTAIAGDAQRNLDFYVGVLGLRLVKKTVNFDDPTTYHLYYGDEAGHPGTILTFFPWPGAPRGRRGTGQVTATSFSIPEDAMGYWIERLKRFAVQWEATTSRFDEEVLTLYDPDGLKLELVAHAGQAMSSWNDSLVDPEYAIRGIRSVTLCEQKNEATSELLSGTLNFRRLKREDNRTRFKIGKDDMGGYVDLLRFPGEKAGRIAVGTVHHVAWRVGNFDQQSLWREKIADADIRVTRVMDRNYFRSIYFHEPGGILFEIATDPPGFIFDEDLDQLGSHLKLPSWLENRRAELEQVLPQLIMPTFAGEMKSTGRISSPASGGKRAQK